MHMNRRQTTGRAAFTLIELLVVIFLISFIAGLTVVIGPSLIFSEPSSRGAQLLQSNLFIAKQQALRNLSPYGVRLLPDPTDGQVRSFQFIQQPSDFTGGNVQATIPNTVTFFGVDYTGGLLDPSLWPVQVGDFIQIQGGTPHRITGLQPPNVATVSAATPFAAAMALPSNDYRIFRSPRPAAGEDTMFLPDNVIVDLSLSSLAADPNTGKLDILFAPAGPVLGQAALNGKVILWVRDSTQNAATTSQQSLIVVFTRTGLIASYPVDTSNPGNPAQAYSYIQNPRAAGGL